MTKGSAKVRWLLAGQELLRTGGIRSVKLDALCEEAGLTTGSFYHHFRNIATYRNELATFYGGDQVQELISSIAVEDPYERLAAVAELAHDKSLAPLDIAMRDWAGSDQRAAAAVEAADFAMLEHFAQLFEDLGHRQDEARLRALLLLSAGVSRVHNPWKVPNVTSTLLKLLAGRCSELNQRR